VPVGDLVEWLDEHGAPAFVWYVKRLSGNDTLANGSHQAGPYIPRDFLFEIFPALNRREVKNPDVRFNLYVDSHPDVREVRAIWYNNRFHDTGAARGRASRASAAATPPCSTQKAQARSPYLRFSGFRRARRPTAMSGSVATKQRRIWSRIASARSSRANI
jgi:hypothetical protein